MLANLTFFMDAFSFWNPKKSEEDNGSIPLLKIFIENTSNICFWKYVRQLHFSVQLSLKCQLQLTLKSLLDSLLISKVKYWRRYCCYSGIKHSASYFKESCRVDISWLDKNLCPLVLRVCNCHGNDDIMMGFNMVWCLKILLILVKYMLIRWNIK